MPSCVFTVNVTHSWCSPKKEEINIYVPIAPMQRTIYKSFLTSLDKMTVQDILGADGVAGDGDEENTAAEAAIVDAVKKVHKHATASAYQKMKAIMFNLKMCCSHPYLCMTEDMPFMVHFC
jgi:SNF2 family DNA or RNA helicase